MKKLVALSDYGFILLMFLIFMQFHPAIAQNQLSDAQVQERLKEIHQMLAQGKPSANRWWYGWLGAYSAATIAQGTVYFASDDKETRQDMALGAATTFLGAMGQIISPMVAGTAPNRLAGLSGNSPEERYNRLMEAEKLLRACALQEKLGKSWKMHALTGVVNLGSGLVVWLGFKRSIWEGIGNFALNTVITEVQIWTQPSRAIKDYENYVKKYHSGEKLSCREPVTSWSIVASPGGLGIRIEF